MNDRLLPNMHFLCSESRMLSGLCVAYGTQNESESTYCGNAQEVLLTENGFIPHVRPLRDDSVYDLASLTKLFTTVCTLALVARKKLSLHEKIGQIDSRFANLTNISVHDMLSFCVSLQTPGRIDTAFDREEALSRLFAVSVCEMPAVRVYSDINAMVIKYIIEAKTNMPFFDALKTYVLIPAEMTETFSHVPESLLSRCVCYNYEHRIAGSTWTLRTDTPLGVPHDPKALILSQGGSDLCGHAGLFSTQRDMVRFAQSLLGGKIIPRDMLGEIGVNRTGKPNSDGTYRQYLGYLCFAKHPLQRLSEVPAFMSNHALGLSGFTGNHLSIDPVTDRFVLFLGNRCHARVSSIVPPDGKTLQDYGLDADGTGFVRWKDGRMVPSSAKYVYFKDQCLHMPIAERMGWNQSNFMPVKSNVAK